MIVISRLVMADRQLAEVQFVDAHFFRKRSVIDNEVQGRK